MTAQEQGKGFIFALGALLVLAVFLYTASHVSLILRERDLWWHIKTGQWIMEQGAVPRTDPFSYMASGQSWIAKEWLSQVIFAVVYVAAGWAGPLLAAAIMVALTAALIYASATRHIQPVFAAALVSVMIFVTQGVTVARPHVFTFPLVVALAVLAFDAARDRRAPPWWSLLLIMLWTNLHGSFAIAFVIGGCAFFDYLERARFSDWGTIIKWVTWLALSALATLINPYFITPYLVALTLAGGLDVMNRISEWAPFTPAGNSVIEAGFILVFFALLKVRAKFTFGQIIFTLMAFHMMLTHLRFIYVFFFAVPLVLLPEIAEAAPSLSRAAWMARARDGLERFVGTSSKAFAGIAALIFVGTSAYALTGNRVVPPETASISKAVAWIDQNRSTHPALQTHVFNDLNFGGPLILAGIPTYIDNRTEQLYGGPVLDDYLKALDADGRDTLAKLLARPDIGWAIFPVKDPRQLNMQTIPGWRQVYSDDVAAIWEKATN